MEEIKNTSAQKDFQDAYEKEHYKAVYLANRVASWKTRWTTCSLS